MDIMTIKQLIELTEHIPSVLLWRWIKLSYESYSEKNGQTLSFSMDQLLETKIADLPHLVGDFNPFAEVQRDYKRLVARVMHQYSGVDKSLLIDRYKLVGPNSNLNLPVQKLVELDIPLFHAGEEVVDAASPSLDYSSFFTDPDESTEAFLKVLSPPALPGPQSSPLESSLLSTQVGDFCLSFSLSFSVMVLLFLWQHWFLVKMYWVSKKLSQQTNKSRG